MVEISDRVSMLDALSLTGKVCAEIGVLRGDFSAAIASFNPKLLYLIDPWEHQEDARYVDCNNHSDEKFEDIHKTVVARFASQRNIHVCRAYSHQAARAPNIPNELDFVYIDACHNYADVMADLCLWYPKVKVGGWLCGHDYGRSTFIGVKQAVSDFCRITKEKIEIVTQENWGSFAIKVAAR